MRIRYKKWARPELEASKFYEDNPEEWKGKWKEHFTKTSNPIHLELGCGKGQFISKLAVENQNTKVSGDTKLLQIPFVKTPLTLPDDHASTKKL